MKARLYLKSSLLKLEIRIYEITRLKKKDSEPLFRLRDSSITNNYIHFLMQHLNIKLSLLYVRYNCAAGARVHQLHHHHHIFLAPRESCGYLQGEAIIEVHIQVYID